MADQIPDSTKPVAYFYELPGIGKELVLDCNGEYARKLLEAGYTETPLYTRATSLSQNVVSLVIAAREAFDTGSLPDDEQTALDKALECFASAVPHENEPARAAPPAPIAEGVTCIAKPLTEDERKAAIDKWIAPPAMDREAVLDAVERNWNAGPDALTNAILSTLSADALRRGEGETVAAIGARTVAVDPVRLAERFCATPLPETVCADLCATQPGAGRYGTHLMTFAEAAVVFRAALSTVTENAAYQGERTSKKLTALSHFMGEQTERENVVAWLRTKGDDEAADAIELGSHVPATPASHASDGGK